MPERPRDEPEAPTRPKPRTPDLDRLRSILDRVDGRSNARTRRMLRALRRVERVERKLGI